MRTIVHVILTMAAAAGVAGNAHAVDPVNAAGMDAVTRKSGQAQTATFPDVAKTPSPGGPVPIPYPNMGQGDKDAKKKAPKSAVQLKDKGNFKQSTGDEAGTVKGVVSDKNMGKAEFKEGTSKVKVEGAKPIMLLTPIDHNAKAPVTPPDVAKVPLAPVAPVPIPVPNLSPIEGKLPTSARQTPKTDFGSGLGRGATIAPDVSPPVTIAPPISVAPPVKLAPLPQPLVIQPVQPKPVLQTQPQPALPVRR